MKLRHGTTYGYERSTIFAHMTPSTLVGLINDIDASIDLGSVDADDMALMLDAAEALFAFGDTAAALEKLGHYGFDATHPVIGDLIRDAAA